MSATTAVSNSVPVGSRNSRNYCKSSHFEADDVIAIRRPQDKRIRVGLVSKTFESEAEETSSSEDEDENPDKLKTGQIRVEWYPSGTQTKIPQRRAYLVDRAFLKGEIVNRTADPNKKVGQVMGVSVVGDVLVLPKKQTVVKGVDLGRLASVRQYDTQPTIACKIVYEGWAGEIVTTNEKIFLRSAKGYRGFIWSKDSGELLDVTHCRSEFYIEDNDQWYPGQPIKVPAECINRIEWIHGCKPTEKQLRKLASSRMEHKYFVERIVLMSVEVDWVAPITGCSSLTPPDPKISGDELNKIRKINGSDHETAEIGDRFIGRVEPSNVVMSHSDYQDTLFSNFETIIRHMDVQSEHLSSFHKCSSNQPGDPGAIFYESASNRSGSDDQFFTASEESIKLENRGQTLEENTLQDYHYETESSQNESVTGRKARGSEKSATETGRARANRSVGTSKGVRKPSTSAVKLGNAKARLRKNKKETPDTCPVKKKQTVEVLGTYIGELVFARSYVDVTWQDGCLERRIPSTQLQYNNYDLDQYQFLPGSFVLLNEDEKKWPANGYGIVVRSVTEEKIATVSWYEVSPTTERPELIKMEEVSAYNLSVHPDYHFVPGRCIMKMGSSETDRPLLCNIGEVIMVNAQKGQVEIRWLDNKNSGMTEQCFPTELIGVFHSDVDEPMDEWSTEDSSNSGNLTDIEQWDTGSEEDAQDGENTAINVDAHIKETVETAMGSLNNLAHLLYGLDLESEQIEMRITIVRSLIQFKKDLRLKNEHIMYGEIAEYQRKSKRQLHLLKYWMSLCNGAKGTAAKQKNRNIPIEVKKSSVEEKFEAERERSSRRMSEPSYMPSEDSPLTDDSLKMNFLSRILSALPEDESQYLDVLKADPRCSAALAMVDMSVSSMIEHAREFLETALARFVVDEQEEMEMKCEAGTVQEDNKVSPMEKLEFGSDLDSIKSFEVLEKAPTTHGFYNEKFKPKNPSKFFFKAYKRETEILRASLPEGIYVKGYEDRIDLFSCLIVGPKNTPFVDGIFLFDVNLPDTYPLEPPLVFYRSYSTEQLNPNLYQNGKVCVSLLGTWSGKSSELWNPGSNLLQVFVSIQGLILNAEPYFNEAGYESRRSVPESVEKSRRYNESSLIRSLENLTRIAENPPSCFQSLVFWHLKNVGIRLHSNVTKWVEGEEECGFPLQPVSAGCKLATKKYLGKLKVLCTK